jgi:hypothetical protein
MEGLVDLISSLRETFPSTFSCA